MLPENKNLNLVFIIHFHFFLHSTSEFDEFHRLNLLALPIDLRLFCKKEKHNFDFMHIESYFEDFNIHLVK